MIGTRERDMAAEASPAATESPRALLDPAGPAGAGPPPPSGAVRDALPRRPATRRVRRALWRALGAAALLVVLGAVAFLVLRPPSVAVSAVATRDVAPAIQGVGTVEAKVVVHATSTIVGRIASVLVDQGDTVKAGQVLARLDQAQYLADVERGEAAVRAAEAQLRDLLAGARPAEIEQLRARVASAGATRALTERDLRRTRELFGKELIAAQDVDRASQAHDVAAAAERDARQALELGLEGARKDQVDAARAQLQAAQFALVLAREKLADTVIASPLDGYIVSRDLEAGGIASPGVAIFKIADPRTAWATVHVDERDTGGLNVGDRAEVTLRSLPDRRLRGRVARIRRESDRVTEQLAVDIAFADRPARLTLGEQVEVRILLPARREAIAVPIAAVVRRPDGPGALVVDGERIHFRSVRFGAVDRTGWIEVLDGLAPGEDVVAAPGRLADPANEGRRVRPARAAPEPRAPGAR